MKTINTLLNSDWFETAVLMVLFLAFGFGLAWCFPEMRA